MEKFTSVILLLRQNHNAGSAWLHPPAERRISFVLPVLLPESVEHSAPPSSSKTNCFMASCFQKADILFSCLVNGARSRTPLNQ